MVHFWRRTAATHEHRGGGILGWCFDYSSTTYKVGSFFTLPQKGDYVMTSQQRDWLHSVEPAELESESVVDEPSHPPPPAIRRVGAALQRYPLVYGTAVRALQLRGLVRRTRQLNRYLAEVPAEKRCLSIGSGLNVLDGWLCTDPVPVRSATVHLDAIKPWPIPSVSFRYMACEHMIEHVPYEAGLQLISEAHRVLQRDGVLRISTPNLDVFRQLPDSKDPDAKEYIRWSNCTYGTPAERADEDSPVHVLNRMMREWGHIYLYDEETLRRALIRAGFRRVVRCEPGTSEHAELVGVDRHAVAIGPLANRIESLILEATA
jgi:predicted SAM-dependent methyltransferase